MKKSKWNKVNKGHSATSSSACVASLAKPGIGVVGDYNLPATFINKKDVESAPAKDMKRLRRRHDAKRHDRKPVKSSVIDWKMTVDEISRIVGNHVSASSSNVHHVVRALISGVMPRFIGSGGALSSSPLRAFAEFARYANIEATLVDASTPEAYKAGLRHYMALLSSCAPDVRQAYHGFIANKAIDAMRRAMPERKAARKDEDHVKERENKRRQRDKRHVIKVVTAMSPRVIERIGKEEIVKSCNADGKVEYLVREIGGTNGIVFDTLGAARNHANPEHKAA